MFESGVRQDFLLILLFLARPRFITFFWGFFYVVKDLYGLWHITFVHILILNVKRQKTASQLAYICGEKYEKTNINSETKYSQKMYKKFTSSKIDKWPT